MNVVIPADAHHRVWRHLRTLRMACNDPRVDGFMPSAKEVRDRILSDMDEDSEDAKIKVASNSLGFAHHLRVLWGESRLKH